MLSIKQMGEQHLDQAFAFTRRLRWPHRHADWQQALMLGEGLVAEQQGELLGTLLYWPWGAHYASIGLVIVADKAQGQGIGKKLMQAALAELGTRNVRLHATEMGKGLYEKLGFVAVGHIQQHQCSQLVTITAIQPAKGQVLRAARRDEAEQFALLDCQAHGQQRPALIASLFDSALRFLVLETQGRISGFACLRDFGHGYAIGPVICSSLTAAKIVISELLSGLQGQFVRIDTDSAYGLGDWLNGLGLIQVDSPTTMMRGVAWQPDGMQAFGLMTQAMA